MMTRTAASVCKRATISAAFFAGSYPHARAQDEDEDEDARVVVLVERLSRASVGAGRETRIIIIIGTARRALRDALDVDDDARSARVSSRARRKDEERVSSRPSRAMRTSSSDPRGRERDGRVERR
jgi:hypothetical protein|tara:strand:+ start:370 stop:747 length:378 start_codon:yes stop_codon:yes gene_type:complete